MVQFSSKYRSKETEVMDSMDLQGEEMRTLLNDLKRINTWLGGFSITLDGIDQLIAHSGRSNIITIVDLGCGDGAMLRKCAEHGRHENLDFRLIGVDANPHILEVAVEKSREYPNITYKAMDVFSPSIHELQADIVLCTLFLHHFKNEDIATLLKDLLKNTKVGIVINDLRRSSVAFRLFRMVSPLLVKTKIARHDGLVSIARGFTNSDIWEISTKLPTHKMNLFQKWAFRYQWIIFTIK
ncbi:methyltransferase domain-containing protein [Constantimarinum furrinae]|uniref:Methyltransferase family protein n=1 Tax=Constantimarinum furrinae TaxID=2562285 RepID=A0A7G8PWR2_9FLAO|nr:methyltransferase domain-containing protein [Constantimarinum furrinae]QNJ98778.1 Methyltransferase family protein [Constantimarinum furrinae]